MPNLRLDTGDAAELAELLQFLRDWLTADNDHLDASLTRFTGTPAYGVRQLHHDLDRFTFLLGGNDGEPLFDPDPQQQRPRPNTEDI